MGETTVDTIETMLKSILDETTDSEIHFKLRTTLQLLSITREQDNVAKEALEDCDMEEELRQRLHDLGYLN